MLDSAWVLQDLESGEVLSASNADRKYRTASLAKILIAIDFLTRRGLLGPYPTPEELELDSGELPVMLERSANNVRDHDSFWLGVGRGEVVERVARRAGLKNTLPPPAELDEFWGYTATTATDMAKVYRYLYRDNTGWGGRILDRLRGAQRIAMDGRDQFFGIPDAYGITTDSLSGATSLLAVKQGWNGFIAKSERDRDRIREAVDAPVDLGNRVLHTSGLVDITEWDGSIVHGRTLVVLSRHAEGTPFEVAAASLTDLVREIKESHSPAPQVRKPPSWPRWSIRRGDFKSYRR